MKLLVFLLLILTSLAVKAQSAATVTDVQGLVASIDTFHTHVPVEKVHIHFDKPYYSVGDTIWMKAYIVNADDNIPSDLSKILYADLIDEKDSVKSTLRLPIISGLAMGDFTLTEKFSEGNYRVRAYTNWMRNFDGEFFFDKIIPVGNLLSKSGTTNTGSKPAVFNPDLLDLQFFPESGQMVENIPSKIAFKALSADGLGVGVSGYIVDKENSKITDFKTEHAGMGVFFLTPAPGNSYAAVLKFGDVEKRFQLPKAEPEGYILSVTKTDSVNSFIEVSASNDLLKAGPVTLIVQRNGVVQNSVIIPMKQAVMKFALSKANLSSGIIQLTLFSASYQPVAERLVFIRQPADELKMSISTGKPSYAAREKVTMALEATDPAGNPVTGSFSIAVTDMSKAPVNEDDETTILSNLLLSSDLKGYIEKPNYYFTNISAGKENQLDNLMLTQGWRRFTWKDVLTNNFPPLTFKAEKGIPVSGKLTNLSGKPVAKGKITVLFNTLNTAETISNEKGEFSFRDFDLLQGTSFHLTAKDSKGNDVNMVLDKMSPPLVTERHMVLGLDENSGFLTYLESSRQIQDEMQKNAALRNISLKEVTITTPQKESIQQIATRGSASIRWGKPDIVLTFADIEGCTTLGTCLQNRLLSGVTINRTYQGKDVKYGALIRGHAAAIYLDGRLVEDLDVVPPSDISSIEIMKFNAVILITTKSGGIAYQALADEYNFNISAGKDIKRDKPQEYDLGRQFYSPIYNAPKTNAQRPDLRTTTYWNPDLVSGTDGKASVEFFTADTPGTYRIVVEGLDFSGKLGRKVYTYTVK